MQSSIDPAKVSATVTGFILMASSAILYVAAWVGFPLTEGDIVSAASGIGMAVGLVTAIFGFLRKTLVKAMK